MTPDTSQFGGTSIHTSRHVGSHTFETDGIHSHVGDDEAPLRQGLKRARRGVNEGAQPAVSEAGSSAVNLLLGLKAEQQQRLGGVIGVEMMTAPQPVASTMAHVEV